MIYESSCYKDELLRIENRMRKRLSQKRWTELSLCAFEKDVFFAFYVIRKLIEVRTKISDKAANMQVTLRKYAPTKIHPTILNHHRFWNFYDLEQEHSITKSLVFICNQIIHSYMFHIHIDENEMLNSLGFYFNSYEERTKALYRLDIEKLISLLQLVATDYPSNLEFTYNHETKDYDIKAVCMTEEQ